MTREKASRNYTELDFSMVDDALSQFPSEVDGPSPNRASRTRPSSNREFIYEGIPVKLVSAPVRVTAQPGVMRGRFWIATAVGLSMVTVGTLRSVGSSRRTASPVEALQPVEASPMAATPLPQPQAIRVASFEMVSTKSPVSDDTPTNHSTVATAGKRVGVPKVPEPRLSAASRPSPLAAGKPVSETFRGHLIVDSEPRGAIVLINERQAGVTPLDLKDYPATSYAIWIQQEGYERWTAGVLVPANTVTRVKAELRKAR